MAINAPVLSGKSVMALIGSYETHEKIGESPIGVLYRASDVLLEREVALRMLSSEMELDGNIEKDLIGRGWPGPGLSHPNIALLYDAGEHGLQRYIVTEFLSGTQLTNILDGRASLSLLRKLNFIAQICDALAHAHRHGISHLSIGPENLFLDSGNRAKLAGFGIRRRAEVPLNNQASGHSEWNYRAPEQIKGLPSDNRSDLFSAATIFCELLGCAHPFPSDAVSGAILDEHPKSLRDRDSFIPVELERLLFKSLEKDPAMRTASAEELAFEVRKAERQLRSSYLSARGLVSLPSEALVRSSDSGVNAPPPSLQHEHTHRKEQLTTSTKRHAISSLRLTSLQKQFAGTALIALILVGSALLFNPIRGGPVEKAVGVSQVEMQTALLLEEPSSASRALSSLKGGTRVEVLEPVRSTSQQFVRVRVGNGSRRLITGYMAIHDLGDWSSDNPEVEWGFLAFQPPTGGSSDSEVRQYIGALLKYRETFPASSHAAEAEARGEQLSVLLKRPPAIPGLLDHENTTVPAITATVSEKAEEQAHSPTRAKEAAALLNSVPGLWENGDLDALMALTQKILLVDPGNQQAEAWRLKTRKALRKLAGQDDQRE